MPLRIYLKKGAANLTYYVGPKNTSTPIEDGTYYNPFSNITEVFQTLSTNNNTDNISVLFKPMNDSYYLWGIFTLTYNLEFFIFWKKCFYFFYRMIGDPMQLPTLSIGIFRFTMRNTSLVIQTLNLSLECFIYNPLISMTNSSLSLNVLFYILF